MEGHVISSAKQVTTFLVNLPNGLCDNDFSYVWFYKKLEGKRKEKYREEFM